MGQLLTRAASSAEEGNVPNFVIYMSDDHGMQFAEPYGNTEIRTPNLAQLAREGVRFDRAFNASPVCGPSRTALFTGQWPARNGAEPNHMPPRAGFADLIGVLKSLGYETASIGKVAHGGWETLYGFDYVVGPRSGVLDVTSAKQFLRERDTTKPLCLFFGAHFPHTPWVENHGYDPDQLTLPPTLVDTPLMREHLARYYSSVTATDALLGDFRGLIDKHVSGDTLFLYTSDHGAQLPFSKWDLYDAGTRLPFIVSWPGHLQPGTTSDATICLPDLLPTLIDLAGGDAPDGLDGESFAGVLRGTTSTHRDRTFATQSGDADCNVYPSRSLRTPEWKFIWNLHPEFQHHTFISRYTEETSGLVYWKSWLEAAQTDPVAAAKVQRYTTRPAEELYDLTADPHEQHNLAADPQHAPRVAAMRAELEAWMASQGDTGTVFGNPLRLGEPVQLLTPSEVQSQLRAQRRGTT